MYSAQSNFGFMDVPAEVPYRFGDVKLLDDVIDENSVFHGTSEVGY